MEKILTVTLKIDSFRGVKQIEKIFITTVKTDSFRGGEANRENI